MLRYADVRGCMLPALLFCGDPPRYLVNQPDDAGSPSQFPQYTTITQNMMVANYQSQEAVDNDDGSGFYHTHHNFLVYGHYGTLLIYTPCEYI